MPRKPNDPLVPVNHAELEALVRVRGLRPAELARRAGVSGIAVTYLLRDKPGGGRTQRIQLSTAQKIAAALGVSVDAATGSFFVPVQVRGLDGMETHTAPVVSAVIEADARLVCERLGLPPQDTIPVSWLLNLRLWSGTGSEAPTLAVAGEWSQLWTRIAEIASTHATPDARDQLAQSLVDLARSLGTPGGVFWQTVHGDAATDARE